MIGHSEHSCMSPTFRIGVLKATFLSLGEIVLVFGWKTYFNNNDNVPMPKRWWQHWCVSSTSGCRMNILCKNFFIRDFTRQWLPSISIKAGMKSNFSHILNNGEIIFSPLEMNVKMLSNLKWKEHKVRNCYPFLKRYLYSKQMLKIYHSYCKQSTLR